jgi:hypothetical protein
MIFRYSVLLWLAGLLAGTTTYGQELDKFRLNSGGDPLEARLVAWDFQTGTLTLEQADGSSMKIPATDLHASDMRLVERILKKQFLVAKKGESISSGSKPAKTEMSGKVDRIHGVKWFDNESDARLVARGGDGNQDDRPMIWFRVLGAMTGFM